MRAVVFDGTLQVRKDYPEPECKPGWARIRVRKAGICGTDMEITRGYMGFRGVLGHEFTGVVEACDDAAWIGKRVTAEINNGCGACAWCRQGMQRHCPNRSVLGILGMDGCMADYCLAPVENLVEIPGVVPDEQAVLIEPLSAACEMLEQVSLGGAERAVVLGDGRLGLLCAWVLCGTLQDVTLSGHHPEKLERARWRHLKTVQGEEAIVPGADLVVEATGRGDGMAEALRLCRPRGTIVLKSTVAHYGQLNLAPLVINEITVVGSRCGRFSDGLKFLSAHPDVPLDRVVSREFPIEQALDAFAESRHTDALKVVLSMS